MEIRLPRNGQEQGRVEELLDGKSYMQVNHKLAYLPGRIGSGEKTHYFLCYYLPDGENGWVVDVESRCGSQRFTRGGYSGLTLLPANTPINCGKCKR